MFPIISCETANLGAACDTNHLVSGYYFFCHAPFNFIRYFKCQCRPGPASPSLYGPHPLHTSDPSQLIKHCRSHVQFYTTIPWNTLVICGLFDASVGVLAGHLIVKGTHFHWDDLSYRAAFTEHWLTEQGVNLVSHNCHAYFPFNAETLSLWFMLPTKATPS